jgi:lambda family phage portal protein
MLKETISNRLPQIKTNLLDKTISIFSPAAGAKRLKARMLLELLGSYTGADKSRRSLKEWSTFGNDANADILPDLETLRERSRDLVRNNALAAGAIKTKVTNVVGTGLRLQARIDREAVGLSDEQADIWESKTEREWRLFWESKDVDAARTLNGNGITRMVYQQTKENGDVFILLPRIKRKGMPYDLTLQVIEADMVCNADSKSDDSELAGGIKRDKYGAPVEYQVLTQHPGSADAKQEWQKIPAFGSKTGLRNIIHLYNPTRPGQVRGVPDLAPVIEALKQLGNYTEIELTAAAISGCFTVFIETESGQGGFDYSNLGGETGQSSGDKDIKLGSGLIVELANGEKAHDSNPGRPNSSFDPFVQAILRQIGVALELPFEILIKHFTASYSAARAALLEMWKYVLSERLWLTDNFLKIVYEVWMHEAVASGRLAAPGFFSDPAIKAAYLGCDFIGPTKGQIDELKEVRAAGDRVMAGFSTIAKETAELTGGDWERNHKQQAKERKKRLEDGLIIEIEVANADNTTE